MSTYADIVRPISSSVSFVNSVESKLFEIFVAQWYGRNVLKFNPSEKKHAVPIACQKIRQNRSETLIEVPGSTVTYSRLNRKYNICAFTQEIQVFEG